MTLDDIPGLMEPTTAATGVGVARKCRRHEWAIVPNMRAEATDGADTFRCRRCLVIRDAARARLGRNNRKRGNAEELTVARRVGGRKVGPLGQPWDVEMPGYARLQVRKYATPESLRKIAAELARIGSGAEMPGYVWVEPGRGGERLIVFRLADFAERHGVTVEDAA